MDELQRQRNTKMKRLFDDCSVRGLTRVLLCFLLAVTAAHSRDNTREYCVYERFMARCGVDEIILVRSALYGRMRARRCITSDYANAMGCYSDVTSYLDGLCSGRQNCSVLVATMDSIAQPCAKDFKSYMEANYECVKGSFTDDCRGGHQNATRLREKRGYIALYPRTGRVVDGHGLSCPWIISAESGRIITISWTRSTLELQPSYTDVSPQDAALDGGQESCPLSLEFVDQGQVLQYKACRSNRPQQPGVIYESRGSRLEIRVGFNSLLSSSDDGLKPSPLKMHILQYSVSGCRDILSPEGAMALRNADSAVIVCNDTQETWYLTCNQDGRWVGDVGNCSLNVVLMPTSSYTKTDVDFTQGVLLAVVIGVALGMLIGSLLFAIFILRKDTDLATGSPILQKRCVSGVQCETEISLQRDGFPSPVGIERSHRVRLCEFTQVWNIQPPPPPSSTSTPSRNAANADSRASRTSAALEPSSNRPPSGKLIACLESNQTNLIENCDFRPDKTADSLFDNIYEQQLYQHHEPGEGSTATRKSNLMQNIAFSNMANNNEMTSCCQIPPLTLRRQLNLHTQHSRNENDEK